jgi:cobalamin synthase
MAVLKYFTFLPIVVWLPVASEPWIAQSIRHFAVAAAFIAAAHVALQRIHRRIIQEHCNMPGLEDDEDDFPMKLGLRY